MIESRNTFVCERAERASDFLTVFNSFTVKKVNFFTINVKFKVIFSSKSGGIFVQAIPPTQKSGGYIPPPPIPPGFTPVVPESFGNTILTYNITFYLREGDWFTPLLEKLRMPIIGVRAMGLRGGGPPPPPRIIQIAISGQNKSGNIRANPLDFRAINGKNIRAR